MLTPEYCRMMARYNSWQNESLCAAAEALDEADRRAERGAFFGSVHGTLAHLLWADHMWMSRLAGWDKPAIGISDSPGYVSAWRDLMAARRETDGAIAAWAGTLAEGDLAGDLAWYSGAAGREVVKPRALCVAHLFNHQTHHRGQVHAMLTAAGARPDDTDIFMLPEAA